MNSNAISYNGEEGHSFLPQLEWEKLKSDRMKEGYREGISAGEEASLQEGFNEGYIKGFQIVEEAANLRGIIMAVTERLHQIESKEDDNKEVAKSPSSTVISNRLVDLAMELATIETKLMEEAKSGSVTNDIENEATKRLPLNVTTNQLYDSAIEARLVEIKTDCTKMLKNYNTNMSKLFQ